jgi:hypothetical protein
VRRALAAVQPDVVLIEGPPEADALVPLRRRRGMRARWRCSAYPADNGPEARAAFWPFAEFSPEWQAIRWAVGPDVPVRFIDLPAASGSRRPRRRRRPDAADGTRDRPDRRAGRGGRLRRPERWWEDVVEHRSPPGRPAGDAAAADWPASASRSRRRWTAVRAALRPSARRDGRSRGEEERREAYMRTVLRAGLKEYERVAVVCGAWHVPALTAPLPPAAPTRPSSRAAEGQGRDDLGAVDARAAGVLAGLRRRGRSPGWYHHLFTAPTARDRALAGAGGRRAARDGVPVSSAHVIEATRLAEALATLRGRPLAGLAEVTEAATRCCATATTCGSS